MKDTSPDTGTLQFKKPSEEVQAVIQPTSYMDMIANAVSSGASIESLERLMALKERHDKEMSRKAFFSALSQFQTDCPDIRKTKAVDFNKTSYKYAPLADIDRQIKKAMMDGGLSKRWEIQDSGTDIKVTCLITHVDGHTEQTAMTASPDTSGSKNPIQARGSAIEYMKRYTLIGALGITTADEDIDGRLPEMDVDKLHQQYMELRAKVIEKDPSYTSTTDPDNWSVERNAKVYLAAIGKAREILTKLTKI